MVVMTQKSTKSKRSEDTRLAKVYYNPSHPAGYSGAPKLEKEFPNAKDWLTKQSAYTLHKPMRTRFPTRKYKTSGPNDLWQMDLMEMIPYASINNGYKYILTCIDVFSRFARAIAVKSKDAANMETAVSKLLDDATTPRHVQTDLGKEFYNKKVQSVLEKHNVKHYSVNSQFKAALVERFNRTLRERLNRYFTHKGNKKWIDVLSKIIHAYNKSSHRGLKGRRPIDIGNDMNIWKEKQMDKKKLQRKKRHREGAVVRISRISNNPFRKNFDQNWSEEVFRIVTIDTTEKPEMYVIKDMDDEIIEGKFYYEELQEIADLPTIYRIERVIRTRGTGKHKQYFVKWYGYGDNHNSWITQDQFVQQNAE